MLINLSVLNYLIEIFVTFSRGGSRAAATCKMERFVIIVNGFQALTIITKRSILYVAAALDPPLLQVLSTGDLDFIKTKTKDIALPSFRTYNNNVPQHLSKGEFDPLKIYLKTNKSSFKNLTKVIL